MATTQPALGGSSAEPPPSPPHHTTARPRRTAGEAPAPYITADDEQAQWCLYEIDSILRRYCYGGELVRLIIAVYAGLPPGMDQLTKRYRVFADELGENVDWMKNRARDNNAKNQETALGLLVITPGTKDGEGKGAVYHDSQFSLRGLFQFRARVGAKALEILGDTSPGATWEEVRWILTRDQREQFWAAALGVIAGRPEKTKRAKAKGKPAHPSRLVASALGYVPAIEAACRDHADPYPERHLLSVITAALPGVVHSEECLAELKWQVDAAWADLRAAKGGVETTPTPQGEAGEVGVDPTGGYIGCQIYTDSPPEEPEGWWEPSGDEASEVGAATVGGAGVEAGPHTSPNTPPVASHPEQPPAPAVPLNPAGIPDALAYEKAWVGWRYGELRPNGKWSKVPVNPATGGPADVGDPDTWGWLNDALGAVARYRLDGVGLVFAEGAGLVGVDLDGCRDPRTGALTPRARRIVDSLASYTEVSPSGTGVHVVCRGTIPEKGKIKGQVEMYRAVHYLALTGERVPGTPAGVEPRPDELAALYVEAYGPPPDPAPAATAPALTGSDEWILETAEQSRAGEKFRRLWAGDCSDYDGDHSRADAALIGVLSFYTSDPTQLDRLFRASGLMRPKWDEVHSADGRTYGEALLNWAVTRPGRRYTGFLS